MTIRCKRVNAPRARRTFSARVAILIPAYNEGRHLAELIARCRAVEPALICVVDDCSRDETAEVLARESERPGAPLLVLHNRENLGKQGSLRRGLRAVAEHDIDAVALIDGDLQHDPAELPGLAELLRKYHGVIGARDKSEMPRHRRLSNWLVNRGFTIFAGVDFVDVQSGLRLYRKPIADALAVWLPPGGGFAVEHESLALLARLGHAFGGPVKVAAAPIACRYGEETSHISLLDILRLGIQTIRQGWRLRREMRRPQLAATTG